MAFIDCTNKFPQTFAIKFQRLSSKHTCGSYKILLANLKISCIMLFGVVYNCINCGGRLRTTPRRSLMRRVLFLLSKNIDIDSKFSLEEKKEKPQTKIPAIPILLFTFYSLLASEQTPALIASLIHEQVFSPYLGWDFLFRSQSGLYLPA